MRFHAINIRSTPVRQLETHNTVLQSCLDLPLAGCHVRLLEPVWRVKIVSGNLLGLFLLISLLVSRFFDGGIGLTGTFAVGMYISAKLRRHVEQIGSSRDMMPPLPDPSLFSRAAAEGIPEGLPNGTLVSQPPR